MSRKYDYSLEESLPPGMGYEIDKINNPSNAFLLPIISSVVAIGTGIVKGADTNLSFTAVGLSSLASGAVAGGTSYLANQYLHNRISNQTKLSLSVGLGLCCGSLGVDLTDKYNGDSESSSSEMLKAGLVLGCKGAAIVNAFSRGNTLITGKETNDSEVDDLYDLPLNQLDW